MLEDGSCESLGTRTLPIGRDDCCPSEPPDGMMSCGVRPSVRVGRASASETLPAAVALSDVSFFNDSADDDDDDECGVPGAFQHTLAIIKPEAARLMYKIEAIMERNGFVVKTVIFFFVFSDSERGKRIMFRTPTYNYVCVIFTMTVFCFFSFYTFHGVEVLR